MTSEKQIMVQVESKLDVTLTNFLQPFLQILQNIRFYKTKYCVLYIHYYIHTYLEFNDTRSYIVVG